MRDRELGRSAEPSSWRKGPAADPAESSGGRSAAAAAPSTEPYRPPREVKFRNTRTDKYSSRPESDNNMDNNRDRRDYADDRRDDHAPPRRAEAEPPASSWRNARAAPEPDQRGPRGDGGVPPERTARDFGALRDPAARKAMEMERPGGGFRDGREMRRDDRGEMRRGGDDRDIRRGDDRDMRRGDDRDTRRGGGDDREIRRGGGEDREIRRGPPANSAPPREEQSSWRSAPRTASDRPQEITRDRGAARPDRDDGGRAPRSDKEERPPMSRPTDRKRESLSL